MRIQKIHGRSAQKARDDAHETIAAEAEAAAKREVAGAVKAEAYFVYGYNHPPLVTVWDKDGTGHLFRYTPEGE